MRLPTPSDGLATSRFGTEATRTIEDFQKQAASMRAERRAVRLSLREGIDSLENRLLVINLLGLWAFSGKIRGQTKTMLNEEDARTIARGAKLTEAEPPEVQRALRAHANAMAARLASGLASIPGVDLAYPVQSDVVFARLDSGRIAELQRDWTFHVWDEGASVVRWMTAFDTQESDVDAFLGDIAAAAGVVRV